MVVAPDRQVRGRWPQILADGQDVASDAAEVGQGVNQLGPRFAKTHHETRFRGDAGLTVAGTVQQAERTVVAATRSGSAILAANRLEVVVQYVRSRRENGVERFVASTEIRYEGFDPAGGGQRAGCGDCAGERARSPVIKVISIDRGDDDVVEIQRSYCLSHAGGFVSINWARLAMLDIAVRTGSGTHTAQNHERRGAVVPTFTDIGAVGLFADRVQRVLAHQTFEAAISGCAWRSHLQPPGLGGGRRRLRPDTPAAEERGRYRGGCRDGIAGGRHVGDVSVSSLAGATLLGPTWVECCDRCLVLPLARWPLRGSGTLPLFSALRAESRWSSTRGSPRTRLCPDEWKRILRADLVLVTHGHADHIGDLLPVARQTGAAVVAIAELCRWLESKGLNRVHPMNKGGTLTLEGIRITMVHADHSAGWADDDPAVYLGEPVGFVLRLENDLTVYLAGDTALFGDMRLIGEMYAPDIAFLPIGDRFTMDPAAAARACEWLGVRQVVPMHYGTFPQLTGTPAELRALVEPKGIAVLELGPGETAS